LLTSCRLWGLEERPGPQEPTESAQQALAALGLPTWPLGLAGPVFWQPVLALASQARGLGELTLQESWPMVFERPLGKPRAASVMATLGLPVFVLLLRLVHLLKELCPQEASLLSCLPACQRPVREPKAPA